jgi:hypothetical protein
MIAEVFHDVIDGLESTHVIYLEMPALQEAVGIKSLQQRNHLIDG